MNRDGQSADRRTRKVPRAAQFFGLDQRCGGHGGGRSVIVYVESNFILEVALGQEQSSDAEWILTLAEQRRIELVFPGFALSEPFSTITHRGRERKRLCSSLTEHLRQLQRSQPHQDVVKNLLFAPIVLGEIERKEIDLLESTTKRVLFAGTVVELTVVTFDRAVRYERQYGLSPQDSIILSAVMNDLEARARPSSKYFISRNWKDFGDPGILAELKAQNCNYLEGFAELKPLIDRVA